jgi:hypothetical protein
MIHIDRRHPEIGRAANPIRQLRYSANILNPKNNNTIHDASIVATPIHNIMADRLLRQYEEDRRDELIAKRQERERIYSRELIEDYHTILKVNDIENQKRMEGGELLGLVQPTKYFTSG